MRYFLCCADRNSRILVCNTPLLKCHSFNEAHSFTDFHFLRFTHTFFAYVCHFFRALHTAQFRISNLSACCWCQYAQCVQCLMACTHARAQSHSRILYVFINVTHRNYPKSLILKVEIIAICVMEIHVKMMFAELRVFTHFYINAKSVYHM